MTMLPMDARRGILAMCLSMATFLVNDSLVKLVSERVAMDQIVFVRGVMATIVVVIWLSVAQPWVLPFIRHRGMIQIGRAHV